MMKPYRPRHLLPILLLLAALSSVSECRRRKRALRIFSAPPDAGPDQVYRGLNFPKHIDHVAQGGTIGLEYDARRLAGPVGSVWRRVKKFFRGDYKKDWNKILNREEDKPVEDRPWEEPWKDPKPTDEPLGDPPVTEIVAEDRADDGDDDFVMNEIINPRRKNNLKEGNDREREWVHVRG